MSFSFSGHHQMLLEGVTLPEQVWTGLQWSPPDVIRGSPGLMSGEGYRTWPGGRSGYPTVWPIPWCIWCYPSLWTVDAYENITFPQLSLQAVMKKQCLSITPGMVQNECISYANFLSKVLPFTQTFQTLLSRILMCRSLLVLARY